MVGELVLFNCLSTLVGYFMPNTFYTYTLKVWFLSKYLEGGYLYTNQGSFLCIQLCPGQVGWGCRIH